MNRLSPADGKEGEEESEQEEKILENFFKYGKIERNPRIFLQRMEVKKFFDAMD